MKESNLNKWMYVIASLLLFSLVVYKAINLSMTHDESASFFYLNDKNILGYLFKKDVWPNANNHYLNTLSFQLTTSLFGHSEWAIRLLNQLGFLIYAVYGYSFSKSLKKFSTKLLLLSILFFNPYVLDFFSLARGYGISLGFSLGALYYIYQFIVDERKKDLLLSCLFLLGACLSLFSSVILLPAFFGTAVLFLFIKYYKNWHHKQFYHPLLIMLGATLITMALTLVPLIALSGNAEFKWGAPNLSLCFQSLFSNTSYGKNYAPNAILLTGLFLGFMIFSGYRFINLIIDKKKLNSNKLYYLGFTSFLLLIILMIASRWIVGTYYPVDRKTIIFIPFIAIIATTLFDKSHSKFISITTIVTSLILVIHFVLSFQKDQVRKWWFDRDTKEFFQYIAEDAKQKSFVIGCNWHFHPTLSFYSKNLMPDQSKIMPYSKNIVSDKGYDYFVCFDSDYKLLENEYDIIYKNKAGRMILKLKQ